MTNPEENTRPALTTYEDLARMIDYAVLAPNFSDEQIAQACEVAKKYRVARLTVRAADLDLVTKWIEASGIPVSASVSYPHGAETTAAKLYAVRDAIQRGAKGIETVLNLGKVISRQFRYVESELQQMATECRRSGATLIVDFELGYLAEDLRVIACKIAKRTEVHRVRAGSLFGPGNYSVEDLRFLAAKLGDAVELDAGPTVRTVDDALSAYDTGCVSFQTTDPVPLLEAWNAELRRRAEAQAQNAPGPPGFPPPRG
jgi:deoxyribose-phosphate aldolase